MIIDLLLIFALAMAVLVLLDPIGLDDGEDL
jgi:hypothetical protein